MGWKDVTMKSGMLNSLKELEALRAAVEAQIKADQQEIAKLTRELDTSNKTLAAMSMAISMLPVPSVLGKAVPAVEGVRVFEDRLFYYAFRNEKVFVIRRDLVGNWKDVTEGWHCNTVESYRKTFPDDRELCPAEVAELLAKKPLPDAAWKGGGK